MFPGGVITRDRRITSESLPWHRAGLRPTVTTPPPDPGVVVRLACRPGESRVSRGVQRARGAPIFGGYPAEQNGASRLAEQESPEVQNEFYRASIRGGLTPHPVGFGMTERRPSCVPTQTPMVSPHAAPARLWDRGEHTREQILAYEAAQPRQWATPRPIPAQESMTP